MYFPETFQLASCMWRAESSVLRANSSVTWYLAHQILDSSLVWASVSLLFVELYWPLLFSSELHSDTHTGVRNEQPTKQRDRI